MGGKVLNETLSVSGAGTCADKNAVGLQTVTVANGNSLSKVDGTGAWTNYNLTTNGPMTAAASITPKALTATASAPNKVYDGTTTATAPLTLTSARIGPPTRSALRTEPFSTHRCIAAQHENINLVCASQPTQRSDKTVASTNPVRRP